MALKVLTVDDSKTIRMIVKKAFRPFNCQIMDAENGVEGLAAANRERPDLIILDITMPVMNGIEMLGKLKAEPALKSIPVIMLTAESGKENVMQIVKMGVNDYIVKPFKGAQLIERAEKIVTLEKKKVDKSGGDPSKKYFTLDGDIQRMAMPEKLTRPIISELETLIQSKMKEMSTAGMKKFILDLSRSKEINMALIRLIIMTIQNCQDIGAGIRVVCSPSMSEELKGFQETSDVPTCLSIAEAKAAL